MSLEILIRQMSWPAWPKQDKEQRLRMRRLGHAAMGSFVTVCMTLAVALVGYLPYKVAAIYAALVATLCVSFYAIIRTGLNLRFADPTLSVAQFIAAGCAVSYVVFEGAEARPAFLAMYIMAYVFGVFNLKRNALIQIAVFYIACYVGVVGLLVLTRPASIDLQRETFRLIVIAGVLGWLSYLGKNVGELREHLRRNIEELKQALARADELASHDSLTNCFNRRYMHEILKMECARAERGSAPSVCLFDLDHFKAINDSYGHLVGDQVLVRFANVVRDQLRPTDSLVRFGGEEFLAVLSQTNLAGAATTAERVRCAVEAEPFFASPGGPRVTVSLGVAEYSPSEHIDRTLTRVDTALYDAKHQGRNRVVCAN